MRVQARACAAEAMEPARARVRDCTHAPKFVRLRRVRVAGSHSPLVLNRQERARAKPGQGYKRRLTAESRRLSRQLRADVFDGVLEKETNREPSSEENGVWRQPEKETNRRGSEEDGEPENETARRMACGGSRSKKLTLSDTRAACSNRRETGEFSSHY